MTARQSEDALNTCQAKKDKMMKMMMRNMMKKWRWGRWGRRRRRRWWKRSCRNRRKRRRRKTWRQQWSSWDRNKTRTIDYRTEAGPKRTLQTTGCLALSPKSYRIRFRTHNHFEASRFCTRRCGPLEKAEWCAHWKVWGKDANCRPLDAFCFHPFYIHC